MSPPLFVLPGIGADERLFDPQRAVRDIRTIRWIAPEHGHESLTHYAARLADTLKLTGSLDLGGASFGGMIALELARHVSPQNVFLFGSCRSADAVAPALRLLRPLAAFRPPSITHSWIARWFGAKSTEHIRLFTEMLASTPPAFIRWASNAIFAWPGLSDLPMPIHHVHGNRDRLIPIQRVRPDRVIAGAGHLLTITHAGAVNDFLKTTAQ